MRVPPGRLIRPGAASRRHVPGSRHRRNAAVDIYELTPCRTTLYRSQTGGAVARHAATCGTRSGETPHEKQKKCPRRPAATITTLTAATGKVLTEFVGFRPTDLGHLKFRTRRKERQRYGNRTENVLCGKVDGGFQDAAITRSTLPRRAPIQRLHQALSVPKRRRTDRIVR